MKAVNEVTLSYKKDNYESPCITSSRSAEEILRQDWEDMDLVESFKILLLDNNHQVKAVFLASKGGVTSCVVDVRVIFCAAIKCLATAIIIAHCHPSGTLKASQADVEITRKLKEAGNILDIKVLDHLILTSNGYYSFADNGLVL